MADSITLIKSASFLRNLGSTDRTLCYRARAYHVNIAYPTCGSKESVLFINKKNLVSPDQLFQFFLVISQQYGLTAYLNIVNRNSSNRRNNVRQFLYVLNHILGVQFPTCMTIGKDIQISRYTISLRTRLFISLYIW